MQYRKCTVYIRSLAFVIIFCCLTVHYSKVMLPKFYADNDWPTTSTYLEFYQMKRNTVDVLVLGSSRAVSSFSPQILYDEYGIRSYNLACEEQNLLISYYWLKEALRYQKPEVVVLEPHMVFDYMEEEPLNSSERCLRKAVDYMKWSSVKYEAVRDICEKDKEQTVVSFLFPALRFHERWNDLQEQDFGTNEQMLLSGLKGFSGLSGKNTDSYNWVDGKEKCQEHEPMVPVMQEYLDKIVKLCKEEEISLFLFMAPSRDCSIEKYTAILDYAEKKEIPYIDLNEKNIYEELNYDYNQDNVVFNHVNIWGAWKVTNYLGKEIKERCSLTKVVDEQWEQTKSAYELKMSECELQYENNFLKYLNMITQMKQSDNYCIMAAVRGDGAKGLEEKEVMALDLLGIKTDLTEHVGDSYCVLLSGAERVEEAGKGSMHLSGCLRQGKSFYEIQSGGYQGGDECHIMIDGEDYAQNARGINLVIYNNMLGKVVDSVAFDTHEKEFTAVRQWK